MHWLVNEKQANKIAKLNDEFRRRNPGDYTLTPGLCTFKDGFGAIREMRSFNTFNEDNDPWGEHDFGGFVWEGKRVFWKIDYCDSQFRHWKDPLSLECKRVLTIMLAAEY